MAKGKNKSLSAEELLELALVPDDKQSYGTPANWVWTKVWSILSEIKNGTTVKQDKEGIGAKVTRIESIQNNQIDNNRLGYIAELETIRESDWYTANDIAFSHINSAEHVGKTAIITEDLLPLVHGMNLLRLRLNAACVPKYFYYFSQSFQYKHSILERINMAVNQVSINQKQVGDIDFPLPPIAEQQRIIYRIESLFAKLDQAKELAQNALDSFEIRKAAILHKAFTGELTAKWREENGVSMDSWKKTPIESLGDVKGGKRLPKGASLTNEDTGFPYIKAGDLKNGTVILDKIQYVMPDIQKLIKNYTVTTGDIYITIVGACIGDVGVIPEIMDKANLTENAAKITNLKCESSYLGLCMSSNIIQDQIKSKIASATLGKLSLQNIKSLIVPIPSLDEQREIIRIMNSVFEKENRSKELLDLIDKIDLMKKAILSRAFRGELGTNDPSEDSALELLKEVVVTQQ